MSTKLNDNTKKAISSRLGRDIDTISRMDIEEIDSLIEKKINKKLKFQITNFPVAGRGSVYIALGRLMGIESIDKKLSQI